MMVTTTTSTRTEPIHDPAVKARTRRRLTTTVHHHHSELEEHPPDVTYVSFLCGILAGVLQAGIFNPWDRALYLSIARNRPFLTAENFANPYQGFFQSVGHRALSGGLYYPLENFFCSILLPFGKEMTLVNGRINSETHAVHPAFANFLAGTAAGTMNALIVNPVTAIKYKSWSRKANRGLMTEAVEMFQKGGIRPFCNGLIPTVLRDLAFGGTYTFLRLELPYRLDLQQNQQWFANMIAAAMATVVSGPFNLARNVQYATRSKNRQDTVVQVLHAFVHETSERPGLLQKARYVQNRLRIGWGTFRVAVGMSFGHFVYDSIMGMYEDRQLELEQNQKRPSCQ
jgi:hypothetical protein